MERDRFEELKAKAAGEGLTDEEAAEAEAAQERDRSQAIPPGEAREPDYE